MATLKCPTCGESFQATNEIHMPFCSRRCQQVDTQRWLNEEQGLPVEDLDNENQEYSLEMDLDAPRFDVDRN